MAKQGERGHHWQTLADGDIDIFGYEGGEYHNGPICVNCGYGYCHHCHDVPEVDCPNPTIEGEFVRVDKQKALTHAQD